MSPSFPKKSFLLLMLIVLITGCANVPAVHPGRSIDAYVKKPNNEAVVIVSSVVNTSESGRLTGITLQKIETQTDPKNKKLPPEYIISDWIADGPIETALIAGSIPAGRYRIIQLSFATKYLDFRLKSPFSEIELKAGEVTDLGMIIISAINNKVIAGRSQRIRDNKSLIEIFAPNNQLLKKSQPGGWVSGVDKDKHAEYIALTHAQGIASLSETKNGNLLAGTRMGLVYGRSADKHWSIVGVTKNYARVQLAIEHPQKPDSIIAMNELGETFEIGKDKTTTQLSMGNLPKGKPFFLGISPDGKNWYAGIEHKKKLELFTANSLDGKWTTLYSDEIGYYTKKAAWASSLANELVYVASNTSEIRCLNYTTGKWTVFKTPKDKSISDVKINPKTGAIGIMTSVGGFGGVFADAFYSNRCGGNWVAIQSPYKVHVSAPIPLNDGSIADVGGVFSDTGMYLSSDEGKTWSKITDKVIHVDYLHQTANNGLFVVSNGAAGAEFVYNSLDNGKTWEMELSSFDQRFLK